MKKEQQPARDNPFIIAVRTHSEFTLFDEQDGKLVSGEVIEKTGTCFSLQCSDGQIRKFDISLLPKRATVIRSMQNPDRMTNLAG